MSLDNCVQGVDEGDLVQVEAVHQATLEVVNKRIRTLLDFTSFSLTSDYLSTLNKSRCEIEPSLRKHNLEKNYLLQ